MKPRKEIPRISAKRLKKLGGVVPFSSASPRKQVKKRKRSKAEFARIYGSKKRVEFVKSLPCVSCGITGYIENAHIETGGMGRKADYDKIIPLCGNRGSLARGHMAIYLGCHGYLHQYGRAPGLLREDMEKAAAQTEELWRAHSKEGASQ